MCSIFQHVLVEALQFRRHHHLVADDAGQIDAPFLAHWRLRAGTLTRGNNRFRPSFYGRPIHHGCDEQMFGAE